MTKELSVNDEYFFEIQKTIGYSTGLKPERLNSTIFQIKKELITLPNILSPDDIFVLPQRSLDEIKKEAATFFDKHLALHSVKQNNGTSVVIDYTDSYEEIRKKLSEALDDISVYDLPIELVKGHSMVGKINKNIFFIPGRDVSSIQDISFRNIELGNNLTDLSTATYIHEIAHSQTESNKHYTEDFHNKEVLSIFLEKVAALELDPTGELLRKSEILRFDYLYKNILVLENYLKGNSLNMSFENALNASMIISSTLKALKLFDIYLNARKEKFRLRIIQDIQSVFDGKMQVEEILAKNDIKDTISCSPLLVRKHIIK